LLRAQNEVQMLVPDAMPAMTRATPHVVAFIMLRRSQEKGPVQGVTHHFSFRSISSIVPMLKALQAARSAASSRRCVCSALSAFPASRKHAVSSPAVEVSWSQRAFSSPSKSPEEAALEDVLRQELKATAVSDFLNAVCYACSKTRQHIHLQCLIHAVLHPLYVIL
jgi:hypothetical protein